MHEPHPLDCIFGCNSDDTMSHYLECPVLWSIANHFYKKESSVMLCDRMCFRNPTVNKLQRLTMCHGVYHACKNDIMCVDGPIVASPFVMQERAHGHARDIRQVITDSAPSVHSHLASDRPVALASTAGAARSSGDRQELLVLF